MHLFLSSYSTLECCSTSQAPDTLIHNLSLSLSLCPTTNRGIQNGYLVGIYTRCIHVFARLAPICVLIRCLLAKFLHRSSVGSLLRVRCWLGGRWRERGWLSSAEDTPILPSRSIFLSSFSPTPSFEQKRKFFLKSLLISRTEGCATCLEVGGQIALSFFYAWKVASLHLIFVQHPILSSPPPLARLRTRSVGAFLLCVRL